MQGDVYSRPPAVDQVYAPPPGKVQAENVLSTVHLFVSQCTSVVWSCAAVVCAGSDDLEGFEIARQERNPRGLTSFSRRYEEFGGGTAAAL